MLRRAACSAHWRAPCSARRLCFGNRTSAAAAQASRAHTRAMALPDRKAGHAGPYRVGLTGSIGMGKSTVAAMFADLCVPLMDADAVVHALYAHGGAGVPVVQALFPDAVADGAVDRAALSKHVLGAGNEGNMRKLEAAVHPLVEEARDAFLRQATADGHGIAIFDIPLLFEKQLQDTVDTVLVVSCPASMQRERVLARPGMSAEKFEAILAKQVPDEEKRRQADLVIDTTMDENFTRIEVAELVYNMETRFGRPLPDDAPAGAPADSPAPAQAPR